MEFLPISSITVGERTRKDLGDLGGLKQSLGERGMMQPVGIDKQNRLVFGYRRLKAAEALGWGSIPVVVVDKLKDAADWLKAERDENTWRKPFTPTEAVEMGRRLEELERPKAAARQAETRAKPGEKAGTAQGVGKLPTPTKQAKNGRVAETVAEAVGTKRRTYEKAKKVVEAAEAEPERHGDLPAKMDAESVDAAHKELQQRQAAAAAKVLKDQLGVIVPDRLTEVFARGPESFAELRKVLKTAQRLFAELAEKPEGAWLRLELARTSKDGKVKFRCSELDSALQILNHNEPYTATCPYCHHEHPGKVGRSCTGCKGIGWGPESMLKRAPDDYREAVERLAEAEVA